MLLVPEGEPASAQGHQRKTFDLLAGTLEIVFAGITESRLCRPLAWRIWCHFHAVSTIGRSSV
jgi:hypothetical protein